MSKDCQYDNYRFRGDHPLVNDCSLYEFVQHFKKSRKSRADRNRSNENSNRTPRTRSEQIPFTTEHEEHATCILTRNMSEIVPVILGSTIPHPEKSPEAREKWCQAMMVLFKPWRGSPLQLRQLDETWSMAYSRSNFPTHLQRIMENILVLHECQEARNENRAARHNQPLLPRLGGPDIDNLVLTVEFELARQMLSDPAADLSDDEDEPFGPSPNNSAIRRTLGMVSNEANRDPGPLAVDHSTTLLLLDQANQARLKEYSREMARLKKRKRHDIEDSDNEDTVEQPARQRRRRIQHIQPVVPMVSVTDLESSRQRHESQPTIHNPHLNQSTTPTEIAEAVIREKNLDSNPEQLRAFKIIADRIIRQGEQLLMFVGGVGGTGKSHLINAVVELFLRLGRRSEIQLSAPTGAASILIDGTTIHSLTGLPATTTSIVNGEALIATWRGVSFLVIDEISMVGARLLAQISERLNIGKGVEGSSRDVPFGGINVLFTGDFGQLKPVGESCLYSHELVGRIDERTAASDRGQYSVLGASLWRQVTNVVLLQKNHRQANDPIYTELLMRARSGTCVSRQLPNGPPTDFSILQTRVLGILAQSDPSIYQKFADSPIIVGLKAKRDAINAVKASEAAAKLGVQLFQYYSIDKLDGSVPPANAQQAMWKISSSASKDALGILPLFDGMRVMLTENLAIGNRLVNGAEGIVKRVEYTIDDENHRYPQVCYVHFPGSDLSFPGLEHDLAPIIPVPRTFLYRKTFSISRIQLPLVPAYSYTDYKSQGRTLSQAIVDLSTARSQQGVYVMLSRVKSLDGLAIFEPFQPKKIEQHVSEELRKELTRLEELDCQTLEHYTWLLNTDDDNDMDVDIA